MPRSLVINYLDAGCSGGPSGALNGMSIMVGGDKEVLYCRANYIQEAKVISKLFVCSTNKIPIINKKRSLYVQIF